MAETGRKPRSPHRPVESSSTPRSPLDGDTVYLAYSRLAPGDGGCGDDGLDDIGVYIRSRKIPNGSWSDPVRVGGQGDRVQSFRVVDGVIHLTITTDQGNGPIYYETQAGAVVSRLLLPDAVGTSLRVGDDGHARIAFATGPAIRYARVDGSHLSTATVAASDATNLLAPSLVLGPGDRGDMTWTQTSDAGGGCVSPDPNPLDGVYFGTDASGSWKTTRLTRSAGRSSLTLDPASGRIDVVADDTVGGGSLSHFGSANGKDWTSKKIAGTSRLFNPVVRLDPTNGSLTVFATDWSDTAPGIYRLTAR